VSCDPERITAYLDEALEPAARDLLASHLAECPICREQLEGERQLREALRALPAPEPPPDLEARVRARLARSRPSALRWVLPLAAVLLIAFWARGTARFVAWEIARDHDVCFSKRELPAQVWTDQPRDLANWFEKRGTRLPLVPAEVDGIHLVGARYCELPGLVRVPHLYYASENRVVSLFVVPQRVRFQGPYAVETRGHAVRLLRVGGSVVGLVGDDAGDVDHFAQAFETMVAAGPRRPPARAVDPGRGPLLTWLDPVGLWRSWERA
jgi:Putative zinc-finger